MTIKKRQWFFAPRGQAGVTGVEYALIGALLAVVSIGSIKMAGNAVTSEIETMAAGMSTSVTYWHEDDGGSGDGTSTTTTTTTTLPPTTTTTTTTTTTLPPTTTTTTTLPPEDKPPVIEASGSAKWKDEKKGKWEARADFENTWDEDVYLTIEIVSIAANGETFTTTDTLKIDDHDDDKLRVTTFYKKNSKDPEDQIVSVVFRVILVETENSDGEDVTYETEEPVVLVEMPK